VGHLRSPSFRPSGPVRTQHCGGENLDAAGPVNPHMPIAERWAPLPDDFVARPGTFGDARRSTVRFKTVSAFCAEYVPLAYVIEGIVRSGSLYTLTAKTGSGKTALAVMAALAVATGRQDILGQEVTQGRVAYLACENPDDIRMRFMIAAKYWGIDLTWLDRMIEVLDHREKPEEVCAALTRLAQQEPLTLVIVDTLAAFFDGQDFNDAKQAGDFMRRLRPATQIKGLPAVVVAAHPVKNAADDNLVPYGSGAILNEVDGNLSLSKVDGGLVRLHWHGKLRGLEFAPLPFRIETACSPDVLDVKGREVALPVMLPSTDQSAEDREKAEHDVSRKLLRVMIDRPDAGQRAWAAEIGAKSHSTVNRRLHALKREKLVKETLGRWAVTPEGRRAADDA
jgi:AAA domain-containing protein